MHPALAPKTGDRPDGSNRHVRATQRQERTLYAHRRSRHKTGSYARLGTYWGHLSELAQLAPSKNPAYAGLYEWAVEDSNLQPWD